MKACLQWINSSVPKKINFYKCYNRMRNLHKWINMFLCLCTWAKLVYMYAGILCMLVNHCFHSLSLFLTLNTYNSMHFISVNAWYSFAQACLYLCLGLGPLYSWHILLAPVVSKHWNLCRFFMNLLPFPFFRSSLVLLALYRYIIL